jgi:hypothetical protein
MAINLTAPKTEKTITDEAVVRFNVIVPHQYDSQSNTFSINRDSITLRVYIQDCADDGSTNTEPRNLRATIDQMPLEVRNALKNAYEAVEAWAQQAGQLGAGTAEEIDVSDPTPTPSPTNTVTPTPTVSSTTPE